MASYSRPTEQSHSVTKELKATVMTVLVVSVLIAIFSSVKTGDGTGNQRCEGQEDESGTDFDIYATLLFLL